jgi:hypothetical protein
MPTVNAQRATVRGVREYPTEWTLYPAAEEDDKWDDKWQEQRAEEGDDQTETVPSKLNYRVGHRA